MKINLEIPGRSLWSALGLVIAGVFTYLQFDHVLITGFREIFSIGANRITIGDALRLMWMPIIAYGLVGLNVCLVVNIFKPLKPFPGDGLIAGLVVGLIMGLIAALVVGLVMELIFGLIAGLVLWLSFGLIMGLILELE